jgi:G:T-mismatch repair DNA endonuclease (very short patch repair protein)
VDIMDSKITMSKGVYIKSLEHRMNLSKSLKGRKLSEEHIRKISLSRRGNKYHLGKEHSEETKQKISISKKGCIPWNKGKKGIMKAWNKGKKNIYSNEQRKNISDTLKRKFSTGEIVHPFKGKKHSQETIKKIRKTKIKQYKENPEIIKKIKQARAKQIFPMKDSSIEVKIQNFLKQFHLEFYTHQYMHINHGYQCDIFIPRQETEGVLISKKTVIECDGCYWHGCPTCNLRPHKNLKKQKRKDKLRTKELQEKGYNVIRLWGHEIKSMSLKNFKEGF